MARGSTQVTVDGEVFEVRKRSGRPGQYDLDWVSGPNPSYGFSTASSDGSPISPAQLEEQIRDFLAEIDPETGYLADVD